MDDARVEVVDAAVADLLDDVSDLLDRVDRATGVEGLSEARRRALALAAAGTGGGFLAAGARDPEDHRLVGYAQVDDEGDRYASSGEVVVLPAGAVGARLAGRLLDATIAAFRASGGGRLRLWVTHAGPDDDARVGARGFERERDVIQLRCPLPLPPTVVEAVSATRPFRVGQDEAAWIVANNRAFAGHPEQGHWDLAAIEARESESWFDPDGFRVLDVDGRMAGSCWTKVHGRTRPPLGEIYVISVDPDFHGRGFGRLLTRAGLDWLWSARGLTTGMLYVDSANAAAVGLYASLGFTTHHVDRSYVADLPPAVGR